MNNYLEFIRTTKASNTYIAYKNALAHFQEISGTQSEIIELINVWKQKSTSDSTIKHRLIIYKAFLNFKGIPCLELSKIIKGFKVNKKLPVVAEAKTVESIIASIKKPKYRLIALLMYQCNLRVSEVANLDISDIHDDFLIVRETKGKKDRIVPLTNDVNKALSEYLTIRKDTHPTALITTLHGRSSIITIQQTMKKICNNYGIPELSCHKFRHSGLSNLLRNHVDLETIRKVAGHTSITTTQVYLHVSPESMINSVQGVYN